jgi:RNA polymerase sigma factor (sigma-70 family)
MSEGMGPMGFEHLSVTQWDMVKAFVEGNVQKGTELLKKYSDAMREYLDRKGFRNDADDIMQMAYLKIIDWVKREGFDQSKGTFRGMIITCLHQSIVNHLRRSGRESQALEFEVVSKPDATIWHEVYFTKLMEQTLAEVEQRVDAETWQAFVAMNKEDKSAEEVARQFGRPTQWAYDVKSRVVKMIREIIQKLDIDAP